MQLLLLQGGEKVQKHLDELMRGYKISVSFSCPANLWGAISDFSAEERMNQSQACVRLIRLGITYLKVLEQEPPTEPTKTKKSAKRKRVKTKDPK